MRRSSETRRARFCCAAALIIIVVVVDPVEPILLAPLKPLLLPALPTIQDDGGRVEAPTRVCGLKIHSARPVHTTNKLPATATACATDQGRLGSGTAAWWTYGARRWSHVRAEILLHDGGRRR